MYHRQPVLPIDIQYNLNTTNDADEAEDLFNKKTLGVMLSATLSLRHESSKEAATGLQLAPYLTNVV